MDLPWAVAGTIHPIIARRISPITQVETDQRSNVFLLRALPEINSVTGRVQSNGRFNQIVPNQLVPPQGLQPLLEEAYPTRFYPVLSDEDLSGAALVVNFCADADDFETALTQMSARLENTGTPVFNHPREVLKTRRDRTARDLAGIKYLNTPKCVRFSPTHSREFTEVFDQEAFDYPVLVRPAASQTGSGLVKVDGPDDWTLLHGVRWQGAPVYMTQFADCRNSDGQFVKARLMSIGGELFLRHVLFEDGWKVHNKVVPDAELDKEFELLKGLPDWENLQSVGHAIQQVIGLDFFGMDLGVLDDDTFVMFEVNVAMSSFGRKYMAQYRYDEFNATLIEQEEAFLDLLHTKGAKRFTLR